MTKGQRVRVNDRISRGVGSMPKPGALGTVQEQNENGTVRILLDDGRYVLLASWEVDHVDASS